MTGKIRIDIELCKGCGFCVQACPVKILRMSGETNSRSYHYAETAQMEKCTGCQACAKVCPDIAIEVWRG